MMVKTKSVVFSKKMLQPARTALLVAFVCACGSSAAEDSVQLSPACASSTPGSGVKAQEPCAASRRLHVQTSVLMGAARLETGPAANSSSSLAYDGGTHPAAAISASSHRYVRVPTSDVIRR